MFGKKSKEKKIEEQKEAEKMQNLKAERVDLDVKTGKEVKVDVKVKDLTDEEKALLALVKDYDAYRGVFVFQDYANLPVAASESEKATLLFAIFGEMKKLREDIGLLRETIEKLGE